MRAQASHLCGWNHGFLAGQCGKNVQRTPYHLEYSQACNRLAVPSVSRCSQSPGFLLCVPTHVSQGRAVVILYYLPSPDHTSLSQCSPHGTIAFPCGFSIPVSWVGWQDSSFSFQNKGKRIPVRCGEWGEINWFVMADHCRPGVIIHRPWLWCYGGQDCLPVTVALMGDAGAAINLEEACCISSLSHG